MEPRDAAAVPKLPGILRPRGPLEELRVVDPPETGEVEVEVEVEVAVEVGSCRQGGEMAGDRAPPVVAFSGAGRRGGNRWRRLHPGDSGGARCSTGFGRRCRHSRRCAGLGSCRGPTAVRSLFPLLFRVVIPVAVGAVVAPVVAPVVCSAVVRLSSLWQLQVDAAGRSACRRAGRGACSSWSRGP